MEQVEFESDSPDYILTLIGKESQDLTYLQRFVLFVVSKCHRDHEKHLKLLEFRKIILQCADVKLGWKGRPKSTWIDDTRSVGRKDAMLSFLQQEIEFISTKMALAKDGKGLPSALNEINSEMPSPRNKVLQWLGNTNQLATLFFELKERGLLDVQTTELVRWIAENFLDKKGVAMKPDTLETYFKPDRGETRAKGNKRIDIDFLDSIESH